MPYSEFQRLLKDDKVAEIVVTEEHIHGILRQPLPDGRNEFSAMRIEPGLAKDLAEYDVKVTGATEKRLKPSGFGRLPQPSQNPTDTS